MSLAVLTGALASGIVNAAGEIERVWWSRRVPGNPQWEDSVPARVLRSTETKSRIAFLERKPDTSGCPATDASVWALTETWVKTENVKPRTTDEDFAAKAAYEGF